MNPNLIFRLKLYLNLLSQTVNTFSYNLLTCSSELKSVLQQKEKSHNSFAAPVRRGTYCLRRVYYLFEFLKYIMETRKVINVPLLPLLIS